MNLGEEIESVRMSVANAEIKKAIDKITRLAKLTGDIKIINDVTIVSGQYNNFWKEKLLNIGESETLQNKSAYAFLDLLSEIEQHLIDKPDVLDASIESLFFNNFFDKTKVSQKLEIKSDKYKEQAIRLAKYEIERINPKVASNIDTDFCFTTKFKNWLKSKRRFNKDEVINSSFLKIGIYGNSFVMHLNEDGTLEEFSFHTHMNPNINPRETINGERYWKGRWVLEDGILITQISQWKNHVFANKSGLIHSGIEFDNSKNIWFHSLILVPFQRYSNYDE